MLTGEDFSGFPWFFLSFTPRFCGVLATGSGLKYSAVVAIHNA